MVSFCVLQLLSDVQSKGHRRQSSRHLLKTDSFQLSPRSPGADFDILASSPHIARSTSGLSGRSFSGRFNSGLMRTMSSLPIVVANGNSVSDGKDAVALESEVEALKAELAETKRKLEADVAKAKEEALGVMRATGNCKCINHCFAALQHDSSPDVSLLLSMPDMFNSSEPCLQQSWLEPESSKLVLALFKCRLPFWCLTAWCLTACTACQQPPRRSAASTPVSSLMLASNLVL